MTNVIGNVRNFAANALEATNRAVDPRRLVANLTAKKITIFALSALALYGAGNIPGAEGGPVVAWLTFGGCVAATIWGPCWFIAECPELAMMAAALPTP